MKKDSKKQTIPEGYYSLDEMCELLNLTKSTIYNWRYKKAKNESRLPPETQIGHLILYDKESFKKWLKSKEEPVKPSKY